MALCKRGEQVSLSVSLFVLVLIGKMKKVILRLMMLGLNLISNIFGVHVIKGKVDTYSPL